MKGHKKKNSKSGREEIPRLVRKRVHDAVNMRFCVAIYKRSFDTTPTCYLSTNLFTTQPTDDISIQVHTNKPTSLGNRQ